MRSTIGSALLINALLTVIFPWGSPAQTDKTARTIPGNESQFIREVTANEMTAQKQDHTLWQYNERKQEGAKSTLSEIVETAQGSLHRLLGKRPVPRRGSQRRRSH